MFKRRKKKDDKINFSTIKTFCGVKKIILDDSKQAWLPTSSSEVSDLTRSSDTLGDISKADHPNVFGVKKRKNISSLFNTLDSEGESAFKENNPKPKLVNQKTNIKKTKKLTQKKKPNNILFNSTNITMSRSSNNLSLLKNRKPMLESLIKSHINSLHGSVLNHGPEMVSEGNCSHQVSNIHSTPFTIKNQKDHKPILQSLHISSLNSSNEHTGLESQGICHHEKPKSETSHDEPQSYNQSSDMELFSANNLPNPLASLRHSASVTSLNSTVLDHGPEVMAEELICIEKPRRNPILTGAIHSTPAVLRVAGRREQKLLACAEKIHMSESLRALDGKTLNMSQSHTAKTNEADYNDIQSKCPKNVPVIQKFIAKKAAKKRIPKKTNKQKRKKISSNSICKAPVWKANINAAQRLKKGNDSVVSQIMRGNRIPMVDLSENDVFHLKSDNSPNISGTIKLDRLEIHTKQSSIKQFFKPSKKKEPQPKIPGDQIAQTPKKILNFSKGKSNSPLLPKAKNFTNRKNKKIKELSETSSEDEYIPMKVRQKRKSSLILVSSSEGEFLTPHKIKPAKRIPHTLILKNTQSPTDNNNYASPHTPINPKEIKPIVVKNIQSSRRSPCSQLFSPSICITESKHGRFFMGKDVHYDSVRVNLSNLFPSETESEISAKKLTKPCHVLLEVLSDEEVKFACGESFNSFISKTIEGKSGELFGTRRSLDLCEQQVIDCCHEKSIINFNEFINKENLISCSKLGEGVYGEVFKCHFSNEPFPLAIKIVPINGKLIVNNEKQKTFQEIFPEVVSSIELSKLKEKDTNNTDGFIHLHKIYCVRGKFPLKLLEAWDEFDNDRESENDRPHIFDNDQLYLAFAYIDGGVDVEHFQFTNAAQAKSVIEQVALSLAVAEQELEFEHRDLHWGNILVCNTKQKNICGMLNGNEIAIKSAGVKAYIIDFTLSRLTKGVFTLYQNLTLDPELFTFDSSSDYQFEIYKMMKKATLDEWHLFKPVTNVYWLHYLADKFLLQVTYKKKTTKLHRSNRAMLTQLKNSILSYNSCTELVNDYL